MLLALLALLAADASALKLKDGAGGRLCYQCHADFADKLDKKFVHTPVKTQECVACHDPHASSHGKLLASDPKTACVSCHTKTVPAGAASVHQPVREGSCIGCHDPHATDNKAQLLQPGNQVCASCHKSIVEAAATARFSHKPAKQSCATCHDAHASSAPGLLKSAQPKLCLECHKPGPKFAKLHLGYPVAGTTCTSCHDPHGSQKRGMLWANVHQPVAQKLCGQCHVEGQKALKIQGPALCKECHSVRIDQMLDKARVHWAVADERSCMNCHTAHASREPKLVSAKMTQLCATCHADTIARGERSPTKHAPIRDGNCTACHDPHASDNVLMMKEAQVNEGCGKCHDYQKHASHPIGEKLRDPRNRNLSLDCLSCHRAHGTEYKNLSPYPTTSDLCTKCHESFKR